jgi:hypothetical protein
MVDRVDAENCIEGAAFERERSAGICLHEARPQIKACLSCQSVSVRHSLFVELDPDDLALCQPCEVQSRTTGAAGNVKQARRRSKLEPRTEPLELLDRQPAVLADIHTERLATYVAVHLSGEVAVVSTVMIDHLGLPSHVASL